MVNRGEYNIPDKKECLALLSKYDVPSNVIEHSKKVAEVALNISSKIEGVNVETILAGSLLHDIGRGITHSLSHAIEGVKILEKEHIDNRIINIVKKHIGIGITIDEAKKFNLPIDDYTPTSLEETIVSFADNITSGNKKIGFKQAVKLFKDKFGSSSHVLKGFYKQKAIIEEKSQING